MKFGRFLKIGAPVIGATVLVAGSTVLITSCSNDNTTPSQVEAATKLSDGLTLFLNGLQENEQSLENQANFETIVLPNSDNKNAYQSINDYVSNFNNQNATYLKYAVSDVNDLEMVATWTPSNQSTQHTALTISFKSKSNPAKDQVYMVMIVKHCCILFRLLWTMVVNQQLQQIQVQ